MNGKRISDSLKESILDLRSGKLNPQFYYNEMQKRHKLFYRRNLPHWQPSEEDFFITYRLAGSIPMPLVRQMKEEYEKAKYKFENLAPDKQEKLREEYFYQFEASLDQNQNKPYWLKQDDVASVVWESLLFNNNKQYTLWTTCIMPNHVHVLLTTLESAPPLDVILQNHKKFTAVHCNKLLKRTGQFWQPESYDRIIRNDHHFNATVHYVLNNPVKAGLVNKWQNWKWTYLHPELAMGF